MAAEREALELMDRQREFGTGVDESLSLKPNLPLPAVAMTLPLCWLVRAIRQSLYLIDNFRVEAALKGRGCGGAMRVLS
jgi:hypothetical protein